MPVSIMSLMNSSSSVDAASDDICPDYDAATSSSSVGTINSSARSHWQSPIQPLRPFDLPAPRPNAPRRLPRPLQRNERYVYTYNLVASSTPLQFIISVEPSSGRPTSGKYKFKLSLRTNGVERSLCEPVELTLTVDPRQLAFIVFLFPGKTTLVMGGLWCLRVWLRVNQVDHRLFGEEELWIGRDLNFASIPDAQFARHELTNPMEQKYSASLGSAIINFITRWKRTDNGAYKYTFDYEAGGVSSTLFDDLELRIDHDPRHVTFVIYMSRANSVPAGAIYKLRVWLRSPSYTPSDPTVPPNSYIYQRIWKTDSLRVGSMLDFGSLSNKVIMGAPQGSPETFILAESPSRASLSSLGSIEEKDPSLYRYQPYR
ncbi:hypothetical protein AX15_005469 [Amanita polypyramis BW_CC]|nr:hypothetical protein AX15_005469 [Amanita polypyramis BW_CC]